PMPCWNASRRPSVSTWPMTNPEPVGKGRMSRTPFEGKDCPSAARAAEKRIAPASNDCRIDTGPPSFSCVLCERFGLPRVLPRASSGRVREARARRQSSSAAAHRTSRLPTVYAERPSRQNVRRSNERPGHRGKQLQDAFRVIEAQHVAQGSKQHDGAGRSERRLVQRHLSFHPQEG